MREAVRTNRAPHPRPNPQARPVDGVVDSTVDPGFYPQRCPRYQRFRVVRAGNFTFDTCGSTVDLGMNLYRRTANLSASEPRVVPLDWTGDANDERALREYLVPLHDYNTPYKAVATGLVRVQPEGFSQATVVWASTMLNDSDCPPMVYPAHATCRAVNGCPLAIGANRTCTLGFGEYFLETAGATFDGGCGDFNVRCEKARRLSRMSTRLCLVVAALVSRDDF